MFLYILLIAYKQKYNKQIHNDKHMTQQQLKSIQPLETFTTC